MIFLAFLLHVSFLIFHSPFLYSFSHTLQVSIPPSFQPSFLSYFNIFSLADFIHSYDFNNYLHEWPNISIFSPDLWLWLLISGYMLNHLTLCLLTPGTFNTPKCELMYSPKPFPLDVSTSITCTIFHRPGVHGLCMGFLRYVTFLI